MKMIASSPGIFGERGRTGHIAWARTGPRIDLLLLHGFSDSLDCWTPRLPELGRDRGVLALSARGHGESGLPDGPPDTLRQAEDAAMVLDEQPELAAGGVAVLGHSMGARTAAGLAAARPDLVRALILEEPPFLVPRNADAGDGGEARRETIWDGLRRLRDLSLEQRIAECREREPDWPDSEFDSWARSKDEVSADLFDRPVLQPEPLVEVVPRVTCPVLFIYGDVGRGVVDDARNVHACADAAGGDFQIVQITGAGHSVHRDRPVEFLTAVDTFLSSL